MFELYGQLLDKLSVEEWVAVLTELVQNEPVAKLTLGQNVCQALVNVLVILVSDLKTFSYNLYIASVLPLTVLYIKQNLMFSKNKVKTL